MGRKVKLPVFGKGPKDLEILFLNGWEEPWLALRDTRFGRLLTVIDKATEDHAYRKWTKPLAGSLGPSPEGCLHKIPMENRRCFLRFECPLHMKDQCHVFGERMPWCFEPAGVEDEDVRKALARAVSEWREGVNLVVVER